MAGGEEAVRDRVTMSAREGSAVPAGPASRRGGKLQKKAGPRIAAGPEEENEEVF
jgi:hypothetical protein